jgi:hypothetical protein
VRVNERFLRDIVTDAVAALVAVSEPPTLFMRGSKLVRVPPAEAHAEPLSVPRLRVFLDHAADFVSVRVTEEDGEVEIPARPPHAVCESILAVPVLPRRTTLLKNDSPYSFDLNRLVALAMRVELGGAS